MVKKLFPYLKGYGKAAILAPLFMIIDVLCEVAMPLLMSRIIDIGIPTSDVGYVTRLGFIMVALALLGITTGVLNAKYSCHAAQGFGCNIRKALFSKVQQFSFSNVDNFSTGSLVTRLTGDVNTVQLACTVSLRMLIRAPFMLVCATVMAAGLDGELAGILYVLIPVLIVIVGIIMWKVFPMFGNVQKKLDKINTVVQENLIGIRVVKSFVQEKQECDKFSDSNQELMKMGIKASTTMILAMPSFMLIVNMGLIAVLWFGGGKIMAGNLDTGMLTSFIYYLMQIMMSLMMSTMVLIMLSRAKASGDRIVEVLDEKIDLNNKEGITRANSPIVKKGEVEFRNVSFKYSTGQGENVLEDICFTAKPGEVVALIGMTGSAKSTLVNLIPRLYDVSSGSVLIDGVDVRDYEMGVLRDGIGVVLQNNILFTGSISDNLRWGKKDATNAEILRCSKDAMADEFVSKMEKGYDSYIEQGGTNVSGGQRQRLCIARAMLKHPKILILDDSTSAVDVATESHIRKSFDENLAGTTVFIIAQRISSVQTADKILILDRGRLIAQGTHDELLANNEIYKQINASQQQGVA